MITTAQDGNDINVSTKSQDDGLREKISVRDPRSKTGSIEIRYPLESLIELFTTELATAEESGYQRGRREGQRQAFLKCEYDLNHTPKTFFRNNPTKSVVEYQRRLGIKISDCLTELANHKEEK